MLEIKQMLVPKGTKRRSGKKMKGDNGVTIHEAGTPNAPAKNLARVQKEQPNAKVNGWHLSVDDKEVWQTFPLDEIAEHSGKRLGNDTTVGIEIADKVTSGAYWLTAVENAAWLAAWALHQKGHDRAVWRENIWQHHDWSGKDCPYQIRRGNPMNWTEFLHRVNAHLTQMIGGGLQPEPDSPTNEDGDPYNWRVAVGVLNYRESPGGKVLGQLKRGDLVYLDRLVPEEDWARVKIGGKDGELVYVWKKYIDGRKEN